MLKYAAGHQLSSPLTNADGPAAGQYTEIRLDFHIHGRKKPMFSEFTGNSADKNKNAGEVTSVLPACTKEMP